MLTFISPPPPEQKFTLNTHTHTQSSPKSFTAAPTSGDRGALRAGEAEAQQRLSEPVSRGFRIRGISEHMLPE